jgi:hypothetical protein
MPGFEPAPKENFTLSGGITLQRFFLPSFVVVFVFCLVAPFSTLDLMKLTEM